MTEERRTAAGRFQSLGRREQLILSAIPAALLIALLVPVSRRVGALALFILGSHVLVTPLPQEPVVLYAAQHYPVLLVTAMMTLGACVAGAFDYVLLSPLLSSGKVREVLNGNRLFGRLAAWFDVSPFLLLVTINLSPLPLSPFKLLSIAQRYPLWKYLCSLIVGRTPRYFALALLGYALKPSLGILVFVALAMLGFSVVRRRNARVAALAPLR